MRSANRLKITPDGKLAFVSMLGGPDVAVFDVASRKELKRIPVVAVTAFAMKGDEERIREGGCEAYLSKPISVGKFIETIRNFLGNP